MIVTGEASMYTPPPSDLVMYLNYGRLPDPENKVPFDDFANEAFEMSGNITAYLLQAVSNTLVRKPGFWYAMVTSNASTDANLRAQVWATPTEAICNVVPGSDAPFCAGVMGATETVAFPSPAWRDRRAQDNFNLMYDGESPGACKNA